jgi:hypothetical protein
MRSCGGASRSGDSLPPLCQVLDSGNCRMPASRKQFGNPGHEQATPTELHPVPPSRQPEPRVIMPGQRTL